MMQKARVIVIVGVLVSVIILEGRACATEDRRKIVIFLAGTPLAVQQLVVALSGSTVVHTLSLINALAIELPLDGTAAALAFLQSHAAVEGVFDDLMGSIDYITSMSPGEAPQRERYDWGLERIGVDAVHRESPSSMGVGMTIAILDTGIDRAHRELSHKIVGGYNARPGGGSYDDDNGHGTHIAGIIAAALNDQGLIGVAPQTSIAVVKALDANGMCRSSDVINGLQWVYVNRLPLVNMSLGFSADSRPLERATQRLYEGGIIMVAAAGNQGCPPAQQEGGGDAGDGAVPACDSSQLNVKYPARYPWVIAVAATDVYDRIPDYSLSGPEVDVVAPGGDRASVRILSTDQSGGYGYRSGTSQATAHVTGAVTLMLQRQPRLSFEQVLALLRRTARDLGYAETQQGAGLIDVKRLVEALE